MSAAENAARIGSIGESLKFQEISGGRGAERIGEGRTNTRRPKICQDGPDACAVKRLPAAGPKRLILKHFTAWLSRTSLRRSCGQDLG